MYQETNVEENVPSHIIINIVCIKYIKNVEEICIILIIWRTGTERDRKNVTKQA